MIFKLLLLGFRSFYNLYLIYTYYLKETTKIQIQKIQFEIIIQKKEKKNYNLLTNNLMSDEM